jgi:chitin synthase
MSHYGEADEAQRRHYNDGFIPNPYDSYPSDPFNPPVQYPPLQPYPPHNPYASPPPPPSIIRPASTAFVPPPPPPPRPSTASSIYPGSSATPAPMYPPSNMYDHEEHDDSGDSPLLRRHPSEMSFVHIPRKFEEDENAPIIADDARSDTNVRFGRIPQRVPRRYKTLKKVEYVWFFLWDFAIDKHRQALPWQLCSRQCRP